QILEYSWARAQVTVYAIQSDGNNLVSVAKSDRKAVGAMKAVRLAERDATEYALHGLLFDLGAKRSRLSLASR
ncbi:MAG: hypothetical protein AAFY60_20950, partial [Myxococcota bacterium]